MQILLILHKYVIIVVIYNYKLQLYILVALNDIREIWIYANSKLE